MDLLDRMLAHDRWITDQLLTLSQDLADARLDQDFDIGRRTLRSTFDHMIRACELWTGLMSGQPVPKEPDRVSVDEMRQRHVRASDRFEAVAPDLVASGRLDETFIDHHGNRQSFGATILQVLHHNVHHRGEVLHMLQRLGMDNLTDGHPQEWEHMTGRLQTIPTA